MTLARVLQYRLTDGSLAGLWEGPESYLLAQVVVDDPTFGYLLLADDAPAAALPTDVLLGQWAVVAGVVTGKTTLELIAVPNPFTADGLAVCLVTVEPFVPCTLRVNGEAVVLTAEDMTLELTSDVPATFHVELLPLATHWAMPLRVEAV